MDSGSRNVFWGLVIKPGKRYETEVQEPFRLTKACIEPASAKDGKITSVYVEQSDNNEEFIIANLSQKHFNEGLDLAFNEGEKICFKVDGSGTVHLTGNLLDDPPSGDMFDMDDSEDSDGMEMEDSEEETVAAGDKIKEISDKEAAKLKRKKETVDNSKKKKAKVSENGDSTIDTTLGDLDDTDNFAEEEDSEDSDDDSDDDDNTTTDFADTTAASDDDDDDDDDDSDSSDESEEVKPTPKKKEEVKKEIKTPKSDKKQENGKSPKQEAKTPKEGKTPKQDTKTPKQEGKTPKDAKTPKQEAKTPKQEAKTPKDDSKTPGKTPKRTIKGGIQIEDMKVGSGPECTPGSSVGMYYEGRLKSNNKKFDGLQSGAPFKFKLGKGQVIKGWDLGVMGMKVGGKRRLTIPPKLAYGESGAPPDIPPNSTLVFDIECKFVK